MASHHGSTEEDGWKYRKIPVDQVYKKKVLRISPSYAIKDDEETMTVKGYENTVRRGILSSKFLEGFIKRKHSFLHSGLVQIAVKPLMRDGLGAPIVVTLRDARHHDFHNSLLALVKADLSEGPFYFNCFPSFSVSLDDYASLSKVLTLDVKTAGNPLALTYRVVCKAMVDLCPQALQEPVLGDTPYFQPAIGTRVTTNWDDFELQVHGESSTHEHNPKPHDHALQKGSSDSVNFANEGGSCQIRTSIDSLKYPKFPVKKVFVDHHNMTLSGLSPLSRSSLWNKAKKVLSISPSNTIKGYEKSIALRSDNQINVSLDLLEGFIKKKDESVLLGLFQVAIKPLSNDEGLGGSIIVCLRDTRFIEFKRSVRVLVEANVCDGHFYFNYFPRHFIPPTYHKIYFLYVMSGVPLELTCSVVCGETVTEFHGTTCVASDFSKFVPGETTFYHPIKGTESTTKWDEVQIPESWS